MLRLIVFALIGAVLGIVGLNLLKGLIGPGLTSLIWLAIIIAVTVVVVRNLQTNRKVPDASPEARAHALTFAPDASKAAIYILRTQFIGKAVGVNIEIDGKPVAQLKSPRFTRILLSPGAHRIAGYTGPASGRKPGGELDFSASAGAVLLITAEVVPGMVGTITQFKLADLTGQREKLSKTRMVQPDVAEL